MEDVGGVLGFVEDGVLREVLGLVEKVSREVLGIVESASREVNIDAGWRDVADAKADITGAEIGIGLSDLAEG